MFRYILAVLLVNTCYKSLGNPITKPISSALSALEVHCENKFLNNLVKSKLKECSENVPHFNEKYIQCLIFYDMSSQLCAAVSTSQLALNEDYISKIIEEQNVITLCESAKDWRFRNLNEYVVNKSALEHVFKLQATCGKVCGAEELTSTDANFFCKFYNWGLGMLNSPSSQKSMNATFTSLGVVNTPVVPDTPTLIKEDKHNEQMDIPIKMGKPKVTEPSSASTPEKISGTDNKANSGSTSTNMEISSSVVATNNDNNQPSKLADKEASNSPSVGNTEKIDATSDLGQNNDVPNPIENVAENSPSKVDKVHDGDLNEHNDASKLVENELGDMPSVEKPENDNVAQKDSVIENGKKIPQNEGFEYQDNDIESEEGKDGLLDTQGGDDEEDPMITDIKPQEQSKANDHKEPSLSSFNREISQGDYYHTAQDGYSDGDDDHFFTFFLTAVVMAILLYVLYHNKNKVSKVFFGLLVEGRQSGRRRNSRGHAYRRLDTLEQAMSTNTPAPPSKIIY